MCSVSVVLVVRSTCCSTRIQISLFYFYSAPELHTAKVVGTRNSLQIIGGIENLTIMKTTGMLLLLLLLQLQLLLPKNAVFLFLSSQSPTQSRDS